ncbi:TPA: helix-turn-helix domain-containing protein, partial [Staphylococcus aureus]|nr:helix-turn-helix domain-containing protein [Staphylococcus aureus]
MNSFKDRLKQIMSERKISQSELSRRTGIGRNSISDYLNGKYEAKQDKVFELAKALNVNEAWLMGFDISKNRKIENNDITSIYSKLTPPRQKNVLNYANEQLDEQNKVTSIDEYKESKLVSYIACGATGAGIGEELYDDILHEEVFFKEDETPSNADFCILVNGDSMEPMLKQGTYA